MTTDSDVYTLHRGTVPLLVSTPHVGTEIPDDIAARLVPRAHATEDADWHLTPLYAFAKDLGASVLTPRLARYVVDLNRPPENTPMYPGQNNTGVVPTVFFTGEPLYRDGQAPDDAEVQQRIDRYWRPYHEAIESELSRMLAEHGRAMIFDGHSIQQRLPWLFEGELPDLNVGTADGGSCSPSLRERFVSILSSQNEFSWVVDGRFKGGYITRRYGQPAQNRHAVQMEMCWHCYLADPHDWDAGRAARVQPVLEAIARALIDGP
jgi:N-formylglutamate deformylase